MSSFGQNVKSRRVLTELNANNSNVSTFITDPYMIDLSQMKFLLQLIEIHLEVNRNSRNGVVVPVPYQVHDFCELYKCSIAELKVALQLQIFKTEQSHLVEDHESTKMISQRVSSSILSKQLSPEKLPSPSKDTSFCTFCKTNKETKQWYTSHKLRTDDGKVQCPILRNYTCQICGASGDFAHTLKYCPTLKRI